MMTAHHVAGAAAVTPRRLLSFLVLAIIVASVASTIL
jgi:hypothetical protein